MYNGNRNYSKRDVVGTPY